MISRRRKISEEFAELSFQLIQVRAKLTVFQAGISTCFDHLHEILGQPPEDVRDFANKTDIAVCVATKASLQRLRNQNADLYAAILKLEPSEYWESLGLK